MKRKVVLYIAISIDGYIAKPNNDISFLSMVQKNGEDYGYKDFISTIDTVILGRKTYDWIMTQVSEFPHADKNTYIITHTARPSIGKTNFYTQDLKELVMQLKHQKGKNIFVDGGAETANELLRQGLIDELILSVIPVLLGEGIRLFKDGRPEQKFELVTSRQFDTGLVQLHYKSIDNKLK
jgi:dihydrofolate reductase